MAQRDSQEPLDSAAALQVIGRALVEAVPAGWCRIRCEFRGTIQIDGAGLQAIFDDGSSTNYRVPGIVWEEFNELRAAHYQPGKGTWFTARYVVERSGDYTIEFDYDNEPAFVPQLTPGAYLLDFEYYPRDAANTPEWLREMLQEARASKTSHP
ncbi:hypothetical protein [Streptomyces sp. CBMA152]|uniref:hypothetical protein n=1 Tax=Streptomyces sp. CBMA152 TaxID=1896312 RepID=UPI0016604F70|nr:hypothetical protein [Streptomyces sp. CBMA152]MBD0746647.1 hypothetical protein [Streptomyces sp. CBMA152]